MLPVPAQPDSILLYTTLKSDVVPTIDDGLLLCIIELTILHVAPFLIPTPPPVELLYIVVLITSAETPREIPPPFEPTLFITTHLSIIDCVPASSAKYIPPPSPLVMTLSCMRELEIFMELPPQRFVAPPLLFAELDEKTLLSIITSELNDQ